MGEADSITVDPHKLGYIPYPAGAYVAKNQKIIDFIPQKAPYVFHDDSETERSPREKLNNLGQYILEGSKPGASAAAAYVTHKVVPLHSEGFGQILEGTIHACEYFFNQIQDFPKRLDGEVNVTIPFEPDSNLICLAINPADNLSTARMNAFGESLYDHMSVKSNLPVQQREFIASRTEIYRENLTEEHANNLVEQLGLAPGTFLTDPERDTDSNRIFLIRNTLMNPWLMYERDDKNYIDLYLDFLEDAIREELASN
jgi:glutamate/tyrosine decarboxylase-like PLP-dependent enzyme